MVLGDQLRSSAAVDKDKRQKCASASITLSAHASSIPNTRASSRSAKQLASVGRVSECLCLHISTLIGYIVTIGFMADLAAVLFYPTDQFGDTQITPASSTQRYASVETDSTVSLLLSPFRHSLHSQRHC